MDLETGQRLWMCPHLDPHPYSDPIVSGTRIFLSRPESKLLEMAAGAPKTIWSNSELVCGPYTPVLVDGYVYGSHKSGPAFPSLAWDMYSAGTAPIRCVELATGKLMWESPQMQFSSGMAAAGKLIILELGGTLRIVEASPTAYHEISSADVLGGAKRPRRFTVPPVLYGGRIYCRNYAGDLVCVDVSRYTRERDSPLAGCLLEIPTANIGQDIDARDSLRREQSMADTWITDMSHFDYHDDEVDRVPKRALKIWRYFGEIVAATVSKPPSCRSTGIPCRRRPHHAACTGVIESDLIPPGNELRWWCPVCRDNGHISNWENTRWDTSRNRMLPSIRKSGELFREEAGPNLRLTASEVIEGTITWDEETDGELPKIITVHKTYTWEELGRELMCHEGFRIRIELG